MTTATKTNPGATQQTNQGAQGNQGTKEEAQTRRESSEVAVKGEKGNGHDLAKKEDRGMAKATAHNAFSMMRHLTKEMDRLFEHFGFRFGAAQGSRNPWWELVPTQRAELWEPKVDMFERGGRVIVRADLPGLTKNDIRVEVTGDALTIEGERHEEKEENEGNYYHSERSYGSFFRWIPIPEGVDAKSVDANFKDGVLEVSMKAPQGSSQRQRIEVK